MVNGRRIVRFQKTHYVVSLMWNIRNSAEDHRGKEGKLKEVTAESETNHERLWTPGNKLMVTAGRSWANVVAE